MRVKDVADLTGVSVRTLHYHDEIGLLCPQREAGSGYRVYSDDDLDMLQQILFYREMGVQLRDVRRITADASFDRCTASTVLARDWRGSCGMPWCSLLVPDVSEAGRRVV